MRSESASRRPVVAIAVVAVVVAVAVLVAAVARIDAVQVVGTQPDLAEKAGMHERWIREREAPLLDG